MLSRFSLLHSTRIQAALALMVLFLQRAPLVRYAVEADFRVGSRVPHMLRSAFAVAASLGGLHSIAGATTFSATSAPNPGEVGKSFALVFTVTGTPETPASWEVTGEMPPGLSLEGAVLEGNSYKINSSIGRITGTPVEAGQFDLRAVGYDRADQTGDGGIGWNFSITIEGGPPVFLTHPTDWILTYGDRLELTVTLELSEGVSYLWMKDDVPIPNTNSPAFSIGSVVVDDAGEYRVIAMGAGGDTSSEAATVSVATVAPGLEGQPVSQVVNPGGGASFFASFSGAPEPNLQWYREGLPIDGATGRVLNIERVDSSNEGAYFARATNLEDSIDSETVNLAIAADGFGRLINLSTRTKVNGLAAVIPGFVILGNEQTSMLIRAIGPTLETFGLSGPNADPQFRLVSGGVDVSSNDDWSDAADQPGLEAKRAKVGAFPLVAGSKDAALAIDLDPKGYTMPTTGVDGESGLVLMELYDAGDSGVDRSRLVNLSARSRVGTGADRLIPGFVIEGDVALTVLIRAVGPTLSGFGVPEPLEDPIMRLFSGNRELAANDDWGSGSRGVAIGAAADRVGAFDLDASTRDSALLVTLNPGAYTVQVSGVGDTVGNCLVEVYEVPPQP